jgi:hypothetical protein
MLEMGRLTRFWQRGIHASCRGRGQVPDGRRCDDCIRTAAPVGLPAQWGLALLLVVLGAGASFDSIPERHVVDGRWRPPLTKDLFRTEFRGILSELPPAQAAAEAVLHASATAGEDPAAQAGLLERQLAAMQELATTDRTRFRDLEGVRHYLQEVFRRCSEDWLESNGGITNQVWLVAEIESWRARERRHRVIYCTFNYDTILDQALASRFGWDPRDRPGLEGYVADQRFALLKLHGSYDWLQRTSLSARTGDWTDARHDLIALAGQYEVLDDYRLAPRGGSRSAVKDRYTANVGDYIDSDASGQQRVWTPALALPMAGTKGFVCPGSHLNVLDGAVPVLTGILAVGWRGAEQHFLDRLRSVRSNVPFLLVGPDAEATSERLRDMVPVAAQPIPMGFSEFREQELLTEFLGLTLPDPPPSTSNPTGI